VVGCPWDDLRVQAGDGRPSYDELAALVVEQARVIGELRTENDRLRAENERLSARVAELERRLGRNSGNSSLPPSADVFTRAGEEADAQERTTSGRSAGVGGRWAGHGRAPGHGR
jgi:transposase